MHYLFSILMLVLLSCGQSDVNIKDSEHKFITSGETINKLILDLPFINQVNELCKALYLIDEFQSIELYNQQVAQCTFDNISILNINGLTADNFDNTVNELCTQPEYQNEPICQQGVN